MNESETVYVWAIPSSTGTTTEYWVVPNGWIKPKVSRDNPAIVESYEIRPPFGLRGSLFIPPNEIIVARKR